MGAQQNKTKPSMLAAALLVFSCVAAAGQAGTDNPGVARGALMQVEARVTDENILNALTVVDDDEASDADRDSSEPQVVKAAPSFEPCDPDDFDPTEFGGREDNKLNDTPDPGCSKFRNCSACMGHRQCGWCGIAAKCVNTRSDSPECANNDNKDVCKAPCEEMWHKQWPLGRQSTVDLFCTKLVDTYRTHTASMAASQNDDDIEDVRTNTTNSSNTTTNRSTILTSINLQLPDPRDPHPTIHWDPHHHPHQRSQH